MQLTAATVLSSGRCIRIDRAAVDPDTDGGSLWVDSRDLPAVNGFELAPHGACRGDLCIPIPADLVRGDLLNLTAFAKKTGQAVAAEPEARVWSVGTMPAPGGRLPTSRIAPDVTVPDRLGRPVHLAGFRGKKALVVTWASW